MKQNKGDANLSLKEENEGGERTTLFNFLVVNKTISTIDSFCLIQYNTNFGQLS